MPIPVRDVPIVSPRRRWRHLCYEDGTGSRPRGASRAARARADALRRGRRAGARRAGLVPPVRALPRVHRRGDRRERGPRRPGRRGGLPAAGLPARLPRDRGARRPGHRVRRPPPPAAHLHAAGRPGARGGPGGAGDRWARSPARGGRNRARRPGASAGAAVRRRPRRRDHDGRPGARRPRVRRGARGGRLREPAAVRRQRRDGADHATTASIRASCAGRSAGRSTTSSRACTPPGASTDTRSSRSWWWATPPCATSPSGLTWNRSGDRRSDPPARRPGAPARLPPRRWTGAPTSSASWSTRAHASGERRSSPATSARTRRPTSSPWTARLPAFPRMLVDVGTNTEVILSDGKRTLACSCPAGPAFEGGLVRYGMPGRGGRHRVRSTRGRRVHGADDRRRGAAGDLRLRAGGPARRAAPDRRHERARRLRGRRHGGDRGAGSRHHALAGRREPSRPGEGGQRRRHAGAPADPGARGSGPGPARPRRRLRLLARRRRMPSRSASCRRCPPSASCATGTRPSAARRRSCSRAARALASRLGSRGIEHVELEAEPDFFELFVDGCRLEPLPAAGVPA